MINILVVIALVFAIFLSAAIIWFIIDLRRTSCALREFIKSTEETLAPAMIELKLTMQSVRSVHEDVGAIVRDARDITDSVSDISQNIKKLSGIAGELGAGMSSTVVGLRAGVREGIMAFIGSLIHRNER